MQSLCEAHSCLRSSDFATSSTLKRSQESRSFVLIMLCSTRRPGYFASRNFPRFSPFSCLFIISAKRSWQLRKASFGWSEWLVYRKPYRNGVTADLFFSAPFLHQEFFCPVRTTNLLNLHDHYIETRHWRNWRRLCPLVGSLFFLLLG